MSSINDKKLLFLSSINDKMRIWITILSDTIISIAIVQLTAACMVSAAMAEVEAGSKDKHVAEIGTVAKSLPL